MRPTPSTTRPASISTSAPSCRPSQEADRDVLELPREPEWTSFAEGEGAAYRVTLSVRPEVTLGDYAGFPFSPQVDEVTDENIEAVIDQLRDQQAVLVPVEDRGAQADDYAVISFEGRRDGEPVDGAQAERFPLVIGKERMVPGFEANLIGMREDEERTFTVTFPEDYGEAELAGQDVEFTARIRELRERRLPDADDDFASLVGPYEDLAALRADLRSRMGVSALDRARHLFADRIIEYATANATVELARRARGPRGRDDDRRAQGAHCPAGHPLRGLPARHGEDEAGLREEYREPAEHRVKVLLVLGAIADKEEVSISDAEVEAEIAHLRADEEANRSVADYLDYRPRPQLRPLAAAPLRGGRDGRGSLDRGTSRVRRRSSTSTSRTPTTRTRPPAWSTRSSAMETTRTMPSWPPSRRPRQRRPGHEHPPSSRPDGLRGG